MAAGCTSALRPGPASLGQAIDARVLWSAEGGLDRAGRRLVALHITGTVRVLEAAARPPYGWRMVMWVHDDPAGPPPPDLPSRVELRLALPAAAPALPFAVGDRLEVGYRSRYDPGSDRAQRALWVRTERGDVRLLIQDGDLLPGAAIPPPLQGFHDERVAYSESARWRRFCPAIIHHHHVRFGPGPNGVLLAPGQYRDIPLGDDRYRLIAVDDAQLLRSDCPELAVSDLRWMVVWQQRPDRD